jgi:hypothetical protein
VQVPLLSLLPPLVPLLLLLLLPLQLHARLLPGPAPLPLLLPTVGHGELLVAPVEAAWQAAW